MAASGRWRRRTPARSPSAGRSSGATTAGSCERSGLSPPTRRLSRRRASSMGERAKTRTIRTDYLARVEGEGAMFVRIKGNEGVDAPLKLYEPPRFFDML